MEEEVGARSEKGANYGNAKGETGRTPRGETSSPSPASRFSRRWSHFCLAVPFHHLVAFPLSIYQFPSRRFRRRRKKMIFPPPQGNTKSSWEIMRAINPWRVFAGRNTCWRNPRRIYVAHINRRGTCELLIAMRYVIGERRSLLRVNAARRCVRELGVRSLRFRWRKRGRARV